MEYWYLKALAFCITPSLQYSTTPFLVVLKTTTFHKVKRLDRFLRALRRKPICLFDFSMDFNIFTPLLTSASLFILFTSAGSM